MNFSAVELGRGAQLWRLTALASQNTCSSQVPYCVFNAQAEAAVAHLSALVSFDKLTVDDVPVKLSPAACFCLLAALGVTGNGIFAASRSF